MNTSHALIIVDIQNDFCPDGKLGVAGGHGIVPIINQLASQFEHVILTQDWHPADHSSFVSQHRDTVAFTQIEMSYGQQTLWPDHCIMGSSGADFHPNLNVRKAELIIRKGFRKAIDSYSAFFENDHKTPTGLGGYLRERGFKAVTVVGLAFDYCVRYSAEDAKALDFDVTVIEDACRAIDLGGTANETRKSFAERGITLS